jgi:hypothetical protein
MTSDCEPLDATSAVPSYSSASRLPRPDFATRPVLFFAPVFAVFRDLVVFFCAMLSALCYRAASLACISPAIPFPRAFTGLSAASSRRQPHPRPSARHPP